MVIQARRAKVSQKLEHRVLGDTVHANDAIDAIAFDQGLNNLYAALLT